MGISSLIIRINNVAIKLYILILLSTIDSCFKFKYEKISRKHLIRWGAMYVGF
jgi:hypothetical protein